MADRSEQFNSVGDPPVGTRRWLRRSTTERRYAGDEYELGERSESYFGDHEWRSHLRISVAHTPAKTRFAYSGNENLPDWMDQPDRAALADYKQPDPKTGTPKLFGMSSTPGHSTLSFAQSTEAARVHFPAMMALAANDTMRDFGRTLQPDENLSHQSERIVNKLKGSGHVDPNFDKTETNLMDYRQGPYPVDDDMEGRPPYRAVPEEHVKEAKRTARKLVKGRQRER